MGDSGTATTKMTVSSLDTVSYAKKTVEMIVAITMYRKIEVAAPDDNLY